MKKLLALLLTIALAVTWIPAMAAPDDVAYAPCEEPITMTVGRTSMPRLELPDGHSMEHNLFLDYIAEKTGVTVSYEWLTDSNNYSQKVNIAIASGDLPDVMLVKSKTQLAQLVENNLIADLTGLPEQHFSDYIWNIYNSYGDFAWESSTFDNKLMAIPNLESGYSFSFLWVREDWLKAVNAEVPHTLDEVVALAKLFMEKDPGGNGAGKTIGIAVNTKVAGIYNNLGNIDPIFACFGAYPRQWLRDENGQIGYGSIAPETKNALTNIADLYQQGVLDPEFAVRTSDDFNALLLSGKCGIFFGPWWMPDWPLNSSKANNPECNWIPVLSPLADDGKFYAYRQDANTNWLVVNKNFEHPESLFKVLNWSYFGMRGFDPIIETFYPNSSTGWELWPLPILLNTEDETLVNGAAIAGALETRDPSGLSPQNANIYALCLKWLDEQDITAWQHYTCRVVGPKVAASSNVQFVDNVYPAYTETMDMKWTHLEKLEEEMLLKTIMGEMSIDEFDGFVANWLAQGGEEITAEVNEQFAK